MRAHRARRDEEIFGPDHPLAQFNSEVETTAPPVSTSERPPMVVPQAVQPVVERVVPRATPAVGPGDGSTTRASKWAPITTAAAAVLVFGVSWLTLSGSPAESLAPAAPAPAPRADRATAPAVEPSAVARAASGTLPAPTGAAPPRPVPRSAGPRRSLAPPADTSRRPVATRPAADPIPLLVPDSSTVGIVAAPPVALAGPPGPAVDDRARIQAVLDAYRGAYERLDAVSVATLWPGVDAQALKRAFSTLSRQRVFFDRCTINVTGTQATAQCAGAIEYVRSGGDATPQSRSTSWAFVLSRSGGDWRIATITAR